MTAFLDPPAADSASLIEILRARALEQPEGLAYTLLRNGEEEEARLTYGDLDLRARALGAVLAERKAAGERALLLYPPGLEFIVAFFGCLYAEVTAVPAYPPRAARGLERLRAIVEDARPRLALTTASLLAQLREEAGGSAGVAGVPAIATDALSPALADGWREPRIEPG
ncbi:MAG TPA: AMP-binding protein, partial [Thermoanaerobaculia bacterium]|nr:AMP-binding protein [Thermoanaerobaculia bacterium]